MNYLSSKRNVGIGGFVVFALPVLVNGAGVTDIIDAGYDLITDVLIPLAFACCLLLFFWGMAKYIKGGAQSEKAGEEGKRIMIWGIVALFVASCIWGIIALLKSELGIPDVQNPGASRELVPVVNSTVIY